jgi:glycosyltransferase involved in cell wall biosynthesis
LPEARIEIMPNGVALAPVDTLAHPASNAPVVLFMARLHVMKGADTLLEAFALALQRRMIGDDTRLVLAGPDFGLLDALRRRAGALQVGHRVEFPGAVYGADKARLLRNATVFCQPSRHEGFSLSILEALAAGLPVLTTPEANFPEVQSRGCGLICPRDAPSLAAGLAALLGDPARRVAMGQAGRALVASDYTWSGVAQRSFALYAAAMEA